MFWRPEGTLLTGFGGSLGIVTLYSHPLAFERDLHISDLYRPIGEPRFIVEGQRFGAWTLSPDAGRLALFNDSNFLIDLWVLEYAEMFAAA